MHPSGGAMVPGPTWRVSKVNRRSAWLPNRCWTLPFRVRVERLGSVPGPCLRLRIVTWAPRSRPVSARSQNSGRKVSPRPAMGRAALRRRPSAADGCSEMKASIGLPEGLQSVFRDRERWPLAEVRKFRDTSRHSQGRLGALPEMIRTPDGRQEERDAMQFQLRRTRRGLSAQRSRCSLITVAYS